MKGSFDFQILFQFAEPQHIFLIMGEACFLNLFDLEPLTRILLKIKSPFK